jgi:hypothetical protein
MNSEHTDYETGLMNSHLNHQAPTTVKHQVLQNSLPSFPTNFLLHTRSLTLQLPVMLLRAKDWVYTACFNIAVRLILICLTIQ